MVVSGNQTVIGNQTITGDKTVEGKVFSVGRMSELNSAHERSRGFIKIITEPDSNCFF